MKPVVLDLQGGKWRLGEFPACTLVKGQQVTLIHAPETDQPGLLPVPHSDFFRAAELSSGEVVLNDARVRLQVESNSRDRMRARVVTGQTLSARKGITYTQTGYRQESLSERDQAILSQTQGLKFVRYALSYVKDAIEMARYRQQLGARAYLIAKLEPPPPGPRCAICTTFYGKGMAAWCYRMKRRLVAIRLKVARWRLCFKILLDMQDQLLVFWVAAFEGIEPIAKFD